MVKMKIADCLNKHDIQKVCYEIPKQREAVYILSKGVAFPQYHVGNRNYFMCFYSDFAYYYLSKDGFFHAILMIPIPTPPDFLFKDLEEICSFLSGKIIAESSETW